MKYVSTRGQSPAVSFLDAVLAGLAPDGGLYVPELWPDGLDRDGFRASVATGHFTFGAVNVLKTFAGDDLEWDEAAQLANDAYISPGAEAPPWPATVTPLVQIGPGDWVLELFHGPSLSFKDVAMQLIGPLYELALGKRDRRLTVLCATSGDTGGAAVEALKDRERIDLFVLIPKGRVSDVQRLFMTASGAENVYAIEIDGDFDACQSLLKRVFADAEFAQRACLSAVNSVNWARILAQSVYFHIAANALAAPGLVNFIVPTGNFGDAYAGYVAKRMGAPIATIALATNANDILARTLADGRYERGAQSYATLSPAMDIQVASNFERILYEVTDRDGAAVRRLYDQFAQSGGYDLPASALERLRADFAAAAVGDAETLTAMRNVFDGGRGYLACPHTSVALYARTKLSPPPAAPLVTLATAHPAKFPDTVKTAVGLRPHLPAKCANLLDRPEKIEPMANDPVKLKDFIRSRSRAWR